jgi:hypothetical protein
MQKTLTMHKVYTYWLQRVVVPCNVCEVHKSPRVILGLLSHTYQPPWHGDAEPVNVESIKCLLRRVCTIKSRILC